MMKELTIEQKAKAYDEAIERAKKLKETCDSQAVVGWCEYILPGLKEPDDEMIKQKIIKLIKKSNEVGGYALHKWEADEMLAWLEKQGNKESKKMPIWKHWKDGICGNGEGKLIYLIKDGNDYRLSSCLGFECDYIELSELNNLLEKQGEPQDKGEISDGYHTFNELYYYRMLYNAAFFNMLPKEWVHKSKKHHDGEDCFGGGWFIVMANLPTGQISNHYELKDWDLFQIPEKEVADKWDGHTPQEAADRLHKYLLEKQGEQNHIEQNLEMVEALHTEYEKGSADNFKPKFKVGDRITKNSRKSCPVHSSTDDTICEVAEVHDTCYILNTINGRIQVPFEWQDYYELVESAWSDVDEYMLNETIQHLKELIEIDKAHYLGCDVQYYQRDIDWLQALKQRAIWKPSDEQMEVLVWCLPLFVDPKSKGILESLINELKKLKG